MLQRVRGTQDFLDLNLFNFIVKTTRNYIQCHHFKEIVLPILEHTDLFKRSLGLETDVVTKEMFIVGSQNEDSICLRPEATAQTMRAFLEHPSDFLTPWKVFTYGPMFRHERPQKGRFRQFNQINIEIIDAASILYDAYLITILDRLFQEHFLLENYALTINFLGCREDRIAFKPKLYEFLTAHETSICSTCRERKEKNIMRVFDCKERQCQEIYRAAPQIAQSLCTACEKEWELLQSSLAMLSISYTYLPTIVRGLDYYNKTVFEFISSSLGSQSAFCGGGRYDHLATFIGGDKDYPSLGVAMGIERLMLLLEPIKDRLLLEQSPKIQIIIPLSQEQQQLALFIADELSVNNICVDVFFDGSIKTMMRKANKMGAEHVIIIGSEEQQAGYVVVKHMMTGAEEKILQINLVDYFKQKK